MKKWFVIALLAVLASLCFTACENTSSAQFHELSFMVPGNWIDDATSTTDSVDEGRMWRKSDSETSWEIHDGGMFVFKMNYDFIGNLDVGLSDYEGDEIRETEAKTQAAIKVVDARICAKLMAETYGDLDTTPITADGQEFSLRTRHEAKEEYFALEEQNGCAVWSVESTDDRGTLYTCAVPYEDHVIAVIIASEGDDFSEEEQSVIDSLSFESAPNSDFYEIAKPMVGKTGQEALNDVVAAVGNLRAQTGSTSSNSPNSPSGSNSSASPKTNQPTTGMSNAYQAANDYLKVKAFSRSGLTQQLKYEGYTDDEAEYAMSELDRTGVDWNVQATRAAEEYLQLQAMSKPRLIEQLEYEGFTSSQAKQAASMVY